MKSFLIIGMGKFGHHMCNNLAQLGNELMVVDEIEEKVEDVVDIVTSAKVGDCTKLDVLRTFGVANFDTSFVCIGDDFQSSLEITYNLSELGAKNIISLASTDIQAKFLLRNGADHVIYPERDMASRLAVSISNDSIFDYIKLSDEYSIVEITTAKEWVGKNIIQANIRAKHHINVLAVKDDNGKISMPGAEYIFNKEDHVIVMGLQEDINRLVK
ncbi:MAG: TrkA family potassium uptake protein [Lachnospiraceae bacterium]|nr:TrkA family potassium uptake protein [Lachnospiraceae bacterium]